MPSEDAIIALYDFESLLARAVKNLLLNEFGLKCFTIEDAPDFQKDRPRVEIAYHHTGEHTPKRLAILSDKTQRTSAFRGELKLHAITGTEEESKVAHSRYRALVRNICAQLPALLNDLELTLHKVQYVVAGNELTGIRTQDGYQQTTFPFTVDLSIQQDAWETLV